MRSEISPFASFPAILALLVFACEAASPLFARPVPPGHICTAASSKTNLSELKKLVDNRLDSAWGYAVAMLRDCSFLVVGGDNGQDLNNAEIYNPRNHMLTPTKGHMRDRRVRATATLLQTGEVLITGGLGGCCRRGPGGLPPFTLASAELYDPVTQTFRCVTGKHTHTYVGEGADNCPNVMVQARDDHAATLLLDGTVLLTGGHSSENEIRGLDNPSVHSVMRSAEIYDPATGSFYPTRGKMHFARAGHTAVLLKNGKVLISGGGNDWNDVGGDNTGGPPEAYDPQTGVFELVKSASRP